ncbi:MAG: hypothetical protein LBQ54_04845 [Planctomycetaceae bacterium]|nr:hypothetical protein [Planctomycetaceae bacterium]
MAQGKVDRFENRPAFFAGLFAEFELDGKYPLHTAAFKAAPNQPSPCLVILVESGGDLNRGIANQKAYAVVSAAERRSYKNLLYLLESGAAYDPKTIPGGELQRILYKYKNEMLKFTPEQRKKWYSEHPDVEKVFQWLEERGVSFDKPVPPSESMKEPEPFRVNNKLIEMRQKNAEKLKNDKNNANENSAEVK